MRRAVAALFSAVFLLAGQDLLPREVLMLSRIRAGVKQAVAELPDCACTETVARYRMARGKEFRPIDNVAFQILFSGDKELFSWPGEAHWENDPFAFVKSGMLGNGLFALHLKAIFLNGQSLIQYHGMEESAGRSEARYDFSISKMLSGYVVRRLNAAGVVAIRGSFWADPETYDVHRVEFHGEEIPPDLLMSDVLTSISYQRVRVGEREVLLPKTARLETADADGTADRDDVEFTNCQAFRTESTLTFDPTPEPAAPVLPQKPLPEGVVPPDLKVTIALSSSIDEHAVVGSTIAGRVMGRVVQRGKVLIPAGAPVEGRIRRLERYPDSGGYFALALEFTRIETPAVNLRWRAVLEQFDEMAGVESPTVIQRPHPTAAQNMGQMQVEHIVAHEEPGVGLFFLRRAHFVLPAGFKTVWRSQSYPKSANP